MLVSIFSLSNTDMCKSRVHPWVSHKLTVAVMIIVLHLFATITDETFRCSRILSTISIGKTGSKLQSRLCLDLRCLGPQPLDIRLWMSPRLIIATGACEDISYGVPLISEDQA